MNQYERTFYENRLASANRLYNQVFEWFRFQVARSNKLQDEVEALTARNEALQEHIDHLLDNALAGYEERDKEIDNLKRRITDLEFGVKDSEKPNEARFASGTVVRSMSDYEYTILNDEDALVAGFYVNDDGHPVYSRPFVRKNFIHLLERMVDEAYAEVTFDPRSNRVYYTPERKP